MNKAEAKKGMACFWDVQVNRPAQVVLPYSCRPFKRLWSCINGSASNINAGMKRSIENVIASAKLAFSVRGWEAQNGFMQLQLPCTWVAWVKLLPEYHQHVQMGQNPDYTNTGSELKPEHALVGSQWQWWTELETRLIPTWLHNVLGWMRVDNVSFNRYSGSRNGLVQSFKTSLQNLHRPSPQYSKQACQSFQGLQLAWWKSKLA